MEFYEHVPGIKKYLHITVSGVEVNEAGIRFRTFSPTPPTLK